METSSYPSSSRILFDVPCVVCSDHSSGKHYGVFACDGCAGFFKRSVRRDRNYTCKARSPGTCLVDKAHRNQCRACRLAKCFDAGMNRDAVQHERGPRNSTIRRQMALFFRDPSIPTTNMNLASTPALNLALPKQTVLPPPFFYNPYIPYNRQNLLSPPVAPSLPTTVSPAPIARTVSPAPMATTISPAPIATTVSPAPIAIRTAAETEPMCEAAAQLLLLNIKWAQNESMFNALSLPDRLLLLEESWKDLFIIGTAQFLYPIDLRLIYKNKQPALDIKDIVAFEEALLEIVKLQPDENEYACLRTVVLYKTTFEQRPELGIPTGSRRLQDVAAVAALKDHAQKRITEYTSRNKPRSPHRASQMMQLSAATATVRSNTIVELFFKATIGHALIENIISDIYCRRI